MALEYYSHSINVSVPGSLMLMGEHAVLQGKQAIVCAVNKRLNMQLVPTTTGTVTITDSRLGTQTQDLNNLQVQAPFKFVLSAVLLFVDQIPGGFTLNIDSEFSSIIGFGSSAAVTVATIAVLAKWLNIPLSEEDIFSLSKQVVLQVQGTGSGADIAASVYGGVIGYSVCGTGDAEAGPVPHINRLPPIPNLTAIYSGYKMPTHEVIKIVQTAQQRQPTVFSDIFQAMHACAIDAITAIQQANWPLLGELFLRHHDLQAALGTSDKLLDELVQTLSTKPQIYGAKISGAGLGDCVIGLGEIDEQLVLVNDPMQQFRINIEQQGLTYAIN